MQGSLTTGSRGPIVSQVQAKLNTALVPSPRLATDGSFGPKTAQAVRLFQQRKGLTADGIVGPKTAAALGLSLGGMPGPTPGGFGMPVPPPPGGGGPLHNTPPQSGPPGFVDLSIFSVVAEAIIGGSQQIASALLSWIDCDDVPQIVYDRAASLINGANSRLASNLRASARRKIAQGQDPAAVFSAEVRSMFAANISTLCGMLQPLVGIPVIGTSAQGYLRLLSGLMSVIDSAMANLRANGQDAQAVATRIAGLLGSVAQKIR